MAKKQADRSVLNVLSAEEIKNNWEVFLKIIDKFITGERKEKLLTFYKNLEDRIILMPASSVEHFHNCFYGGYVDHVIRVVQCALKLHELWTELGANTDTYTVEELVFAAINHDLGKIGDENNDQYIEQDSDWWFEERRQFFAKNDKVPFMLIQDRSLYLLQSAGITMSMNEYLAIRLHDGLYDPVNDPYYLSNNPSSQFRSNIVNIIHQADLLAAKIEYDNWLARKK